ncbi:MAG: SpoIID/LytB domain-containing protein [Lachnospiraceae bacterium]|nr:SpoIID/LytB domain-containing protein [Lachnospiraceae bacterium]
MGERLTVYVSAIAMVFLFPYILTMAVNGRYGAYASQISNVSTGKDVLIEIEGANMLMDVEQYIAGVLPGLVDPESDIKIIEAQAVAVRTKIYYEMGEETVVSASKLGFSYYSKDDLILRYGRSKYKNVRNVYETATLNTLQQISK